MKWFGWFGRRRDLNAERAATLRERQAAEDRLAHAERHVILPLAREREENHIAPLLNALIERRARQLWDGKS